ncbi:MAG: LuxR C-terminal-related transcriptional regulator [Bacillota bacterium]|nr:LuxR C-terminal-related transcriptional regulator [Bacillota bacterium]
MTLLEKLRQALSKNQKDQISEPVADSKEISAEPQIIRMNKVFSETEKTMRLSKLTQRESDTFYLLLQGYTLKETAKLLGVKYSTANTHMTELYRKLGVNSRAELIINYKGCHKSGP